MLSWIFFSEVVLVTAPLSAYSAIAANHTVYEMSLQRLFNSLCMSLCLPLYLSLTLSLCLLFGGAQVSLHHRLCTWWKLVKETEKPAGVGWGPDIVLASGWGSACQGPLYEGCPPSKTYLFIPVCGPSSDPGHCTSLRAGDQGRCR